MKSLAKIFAKSTKTFRSKSENRKTFCFFPRKKFLKTFPWTRGMQIWQPSQNLFPKLRIFFVENEKILFSLTIFPWTPGLHFWQACQKASVKNRIVFVDKIKNYETKFRFSTKQTSKGSFVDVKCNFDKPDGSFQPKVRKIFAQSLETVKKITVFSIKKLLPKLILRTRSSLTILPKPFLQKVG